MGNEAAKAIVPVAIQGLPVIIKAIRGDDSSANRARSQEDRRLLEALENMQRNRDDIDRILQNQQQLLEAFVLLGQRVQGGGENIQLENGTGDQHSSRTNGRGQIRIVMDLPEGAEEREVALQRFWETLASRAAAFTSENGNQSALLDGPKNDFHEGGRQSIAASAPPGDIDDSTQEVGKLESFLYCEICTQRYNTTDRRPTLLPQCGHTFCKECLCKANRRNHMCPHCRQNTNKNVDQHPTNFAILDFLKESEEDSKLKQKKEEIDFDMPDLTFEEQIEIARQLSLECSQSQQISEEERKKQEEEDRRIALQLLREEERLVAFRFHEDVSQKGRNMNDCYEYMNSHGDQDERLRGGGHYPMLPEESHIEHTERNMSDDNNDIYDDCHAVLIPSNRVAYSDSRREMEEEDDSKESCNSRDDRPLGSPVVHGYEDARYLLNSMDDGKNGSDSDDGYLKPGSRQEGHNKTLFGDKGCEERIPDLSISESHSLYQEEKELMLLRAKLTHKKDKELKQKKRRLKEQEDIDFAMALSLSLTDSKAVPSSNN